jgi:hypothetical protein
MHCRITAGIVFFTLFLDGWISHQCLSYALDPCSEHLRILRPFPYEPIYPEEFIVRFELKPPTFSGLACIYIDDQYVDVVNLSSAISNTPDAPFEWHPAPELRDRLHGFSLLRLDHTTDSTCTGTPSACQNCVRASCAIEFEVVRFRTRRYSGACRASAPNASSQPSPSSPLSTESAEDRRRAERDAALGLAGAPPHLLRRCPPRRRRAAERGPPRVLLLCANAGRAPRTRSPARTRTAAAAAAAGAGGRPSSSGS